MRRHDLALEATHDGAVRTLRLSGQPLGSREAAELRDTVEELVEDRSVRVIVVTSAGADFCPGAADDLEPLSFGNDPPATLARLRPPVVAAVSGRCHSVGLELALAADFRLATADATFALRDIHDGRLPCWGGTQRLPRAVGAARAAAMVLLGLVVPASEAGTGLVTAVVDNLAGGIETVVAQLLGVGPLAAELAKEAVHRGAELPLRDGLRLEGDLNTLLAATDDRREGLAAFFAKRPPDFAGR